MRASKFSAGSLALCLSAALLPAQEPNAVESLKRQLKEATEAFQKAVQEQQRRIDELTRQIEQLQKAQPPTNAVGEKPALPAEIRGPESQKTVPPSAAVTDQPAWSP